MKIAGPKHRRLHRRYSWPKTILGSRAADFDYGGLKGDPFGLWENVLCLARNLVLFYPPFWLVNISARKDSSLLAKPDHRNR